MSQHPVPIILAGGVSSRLWPLSDKSLLKLAVEPESGRLLTLLERHLTTFSALGFAEVIIVANPENEATPGSNAETKKREKQIERKEDSRQDKEKFGIEVGAKSGDAQATKNACAASRRGERRVQNPSAATACDCRANANTFATA